MSIKFDCHATDLLKFEPEYLRDNLRTNLTVCYQPGIGNKNGELVIRTVEYRYLIVDRYLHEVMKNVYIALGVVDTKDMFISTDYSLVNFRVNNFYTGNSINSVFNKMLEFCIEEFAKPLKSRDILKVFSVNCYDIVNRIYNEIVFNNLEYSLSADILDIAELQVEKELIDSLWRCKEEKTLESVTRTHDTLAHIIKTKEEFKNNPLCHAFLAKNIKVPQVSQIIAARGFVAETNNIEFKQPIWCGFLLGMRDAPHMAMESRVAATAQAMSVDTVSQSEYRSRITQLVSMILQRVVIGDCGSTEYMVWEKVRSMEEDGVDDLKILNGKYYYKEDGSLGLIRLNSKELVGQRNLKIRSVFNCKLRDKTAVCSCCFGDIAYSHCTSDNVAHQAIVALFQQFSQGGLSIKHQGSSGESKKFEITTTAKELFVVKNNNEIYLRVNNKIKAYTKILVYVNADELIGIRDIKKNDVDLDKLSYERFSKLKEIKIEAEDSRGKLYIYVLSFKSATNADGVFTQAFLNYLKHAPIELSDKNEYYFDITGWIPNAHLPIIELPLKGATLLSVLKLASSFLKSKKNVLADDEDNEGTALLYVKKLVDEMGNKISVNVANVEVLLYGFSIYCREVGDYDVSRNSKNEPLIGKFSQIVPRRSMGGAYGFEEVMNVIFSPTSFYGLNATDHPMDAILSPNEVIENERKLRTLTAKGEIRNVPFDYGDRYSDKNYPIEYFR